MRIIVCGGRDFLDRRLAFDSLDLIDFRLGGICSVTEGGQRKRERREIVGGADFWGQQWAQIRGVPWETMDADWTRWGPAAGPIRNQAMLDRWKPQAVVAFPGGSGTRDIIGRARAARVPVITVTSGGIVLPADLQ